MVLLQGTGVDEYDQDDDNGSEEDEIAVEIGKGNICTMLLKFTRIYPILIYNVLISSFFLRWGV